jgi:hypothetical protein
MHGDNPQTRTAHHMQLHTTFAPKFCDEQQHLNMRESKQANKYGHPTQPLYARLSKLFVLRESVLLRARVYHTTSPTA